MELLQNADDAGATQVALMLDLEQYPTDSILGQHLSLLGLCKAAFFASVCLPFPKL